MNARFKKAVARLTSHQKTAVLAAVDELAAAMTARDGEAGMAAVRRVQALSPEVGSALLDDLADEVRKLRQGE
ncbi:hypothetical protein [Nonomuraea sp. NPDC049784]|uniref:hypothetical protein n=1 Tax=Nonomuraea sp. NPDC049784 TaxID=3154361 RepID=UPI0033D1CDC2